MKCIDNLAHYTASLGQSIVVSHGNTYCWSNLRNHPYIRICKGIPYFIHMCLNGNSTCRTEYTALSAVHTLCLCYLFIEGRNHNGFCSAVCKVQGTDSLKLLAGTYTVAAKDTLIRVTDQRR